jgi:peptide/nickel transport system permease protein
MRPAIVILSAIILLAVFAPLLASTDPMLTNPAGQLLPPSANHLLGTDYLGRDVFSRTLYGTRRTLLLTTLATLIAIISGTGIGILAGAGSKQVDQIVTVLLDVLLALPPLVLALVILTLTGQGAGTLVAAVGLAQMPHAARVVRAGVMQIRASEYVEAARAMGASPLEIAWRHIFLNLRPLILTYAGVLFSYCLFNSAALSLLGLGGEPGVPDLGIMLADGRTSFRAAPWVALAPGLTITLTILCLNTLIDRYNARPGA